MLSAILNSFLPYPLFLSLSFITKVSIYIQTGITYKKPKIIPGKADADKQDVSVPITMVLDNAGYNKAPEVTEYAAANKINLMFFPPYSPNFNLIERLWKFFK